MKTQSSSLKTFAAIATSRFISTFSVYTATLSMHRIDYAKECRSALHCHTKYRHAKPLRFRKCHEKRKKNKHKSLIKALLKQSTGERTRNLITFFFLQKFHIETQKKQQRRQKKLKLV